MIATASSSEPEGMRDKIAAMALANGRSMTAEVIAALDHHLKGADRITQLWELFEKHRENIEEIPHIWNAIENLEWHLERQIGASLSGIRAARKAARRKAGVDDASPSVAPIEAPTDRPKMK